MYNNNNNTLIRYKIVLLGDCNTGKSCLAIRYVNKQFSDVFSSTIGCSFLAKIVEKDNVRYGLDIWDTAGQERYRGLLPMYYRNSDMVIICVVRIIRKSIVGDMKVSLMKI